MIRASSLARSELLYAPSLPLRQDAEMGNEAEPAAEAGYDLPRMMVAEFVGTCSRRDHHRLGHDG